MLVGINLSKQHFPRVDCRNNVFFLRYVLCCVRLALAHVCELLQPGQSVSFQVLALLSKASLNGPSNHVKGQTKQNFSRKMRKKNDDAMMLSGFLLESMSERKRFVNGQNNVCVVRHMKDHP